MKRIKISEWDAWEGAKIDRLLSNEIFVFGSNTEGRHGRGAALEARQKYGAIYGRAKGLQGQSYAIVTKDLTKKKHPSVSLKSIQKQVWDLYDYAKEHKDKKFYISWKMGTNLLSDYLPIEIVYCFLPKKNTEIPKNIVFEAGFLLVLLKLQTSSNDIKIVLSGNIDNYLPIYTTLNTFERALDGIAKDLKIELEKYWVCSSIYSEALFLGSQAACFNYSSGYAKCELEDGIVVMRDNYTNITISMVI